MRISVESNIIKEYNGNQVIEKVGVGMRSSLLKVYVDKENFEITKKYGCDVIRFISKSDEMKIMPMDFIIITNEELGEVIRNYYESCDESRIRYTTAWNGTSAEEDFSLLAVVTNLYASIQHIRHGVPIKKWGIKRKFPYEMVRNELTIIKACVRLLGEEISVKEFQEELVQYEQRDSEFYFKSTNVILDTYCWRYKKNESVQKSLECIRRAVETIERNVEEKCELENIWQLAYQIHNEPQGILEVVLER